MKKIICLVLCMCMLLSISALAASEAAGYTYTTESFQGEIIIPVTETTGTWKESTAVANYDDGAHIYSLTAGDTATYKIEGAKKGNYEIYYWVMPHTKASKKFPIEISHNGKTSVKELRFQISSEESVAPGWVSLGIFDLNGSGNEKITATNAGGTLRAGGLKLVPTTADVTVDTKASDTASKHEEVTTTEKSEGEIIIPVTETTGTWNESTAVLNYDGGAHIYSGVAGDTATYKIEGVKAGNYEIYFWVMPHTKYSKQFPIAISHNGKTDVVELRTQISDGETVDPNWLSLGVYDIIGTGNENVLTTNAGGILRAGAIKLVPTTADVTVNNGATDEKSSLPEGLTLETFEGEIVIPYTETTGEWKASTAVPGYNGEGHVYSDMQDAVNSPTMTFKIENVKEGNYEIYFWVMPHTKNISNIDLTIKHNGKTDNMILKHRYGESDVPGWASMGVFDIKGTGNESVVLVNSRGIVRGSAIKIVPTTKAVGEIEESAKFKDIVTDPREPYHKWQANIERETMLSSKAGAPNEKYTLLFA
ncbi:MAG: hypothetical protein IJN39_05900, partial [Clostridia bacterium]|nr:hypothetical protein [Clostridia bacterium]